ncbi:MAG TPA: DISARM system helicase DrmA [Candidatus Dormibacteraeota bacterium]|nr:DISARM system helicase DrmA [Candidatus Dormibacteraeota bacterium]
MTLTSPRVRDALEEILERDLLGPWDGPEEELPGDQGPRSRYLVGMVAPIDVHNDPVITPEQVDSTLGDADDEAGEGVDRAAPAAASTMFPRSFGLMFAVPLSTPAVRVTASWGRYVKVRSESLLTEQGEPRLVWRRQQVEHELEVPLDEGRRELPEPAWPEHPEVRLAVTCRRRGDRRVVELALVNRQHEPRRNRDEAWLFQPQLRVTALDGETAVFLPQEEPDPIGLIEPEERQLAMLYRDCLEFAVGRNVAVAAERRRGEARAHLLRTEWLPAYEVPQTVAPSPDEQPLLRGLQLDMKVLAALPPAGLRAALLPLAAGYEAWLDRQEARIEAEPDLAPHRQAAREAIAEARRAAERIRAGIELLCAEPAGEALEAFRFANQAMALQRLHTEAGRLMAAERGLDFEAAVARVDLPANRSWRPFQLAFILLNLPALTDPLHPERSQPYTAVADLLYFPTGGGKTEAYLGLAAYTFAVRRLQGVVGSGADARDGSDGVAVLMRYTLRLLTAQQFQRAATMVCACEHLRRERAAAGDLRLGTTPFRIGLWVGAGVTPNSYDDAAKEIRSAKGMGKGAGNHVLQVLHCPWCSAPLEEGRDLEPQDGERRIHLYCPDPEGRCPFSRKRSEEGLPILTVDEEIYRLTPSMLISTVDKLAQLTWLGQTGTLFGQVRRRCSRHGYRHPDLDARTGCTDSHRPSKDGRLPAATTIEVLPLRPPDLVIQDELHLISGALGTMVGQYETAVDALCRWRLGQDVVHPKVVSSTATVRRAREQVHQLFAAKLCVFPPPVLDAGDTFFSVQVPVSEAAPGRRYRGLCAHGIRLKQAEIRVAETLLTATQYLFDRHGRAADPYLTYVAYFNAMRELAGMKRLVDDDISIRVQRGTDRGLANRPVPMEVQELTSRTPSSRIAQTLGQLEVAADPALDSTAARSMKPRPTREGPRPIDVLLATSMLQVGVDVSRLGLMVVTGQPKNTAEYIQATSRIGRDPRRPGLVVTLYNWARPRDLTHFETFCHYHEAFYRWVEALSVTPFSRRAVDRGLTGVLVALVRHRDLEYSPNLAAQRVDVHGPVAEEARKIIVERAERVSQSAAVAQFVRDAVQYRLDGWGSIQTRLEATRLAYRPTRDAIPLLREAGVEPWSQWTAANSLRETEPEINLLLPRNSLVDRSLQEQPGWAYPESPAPDDPDLDGNAAPIPEPAPSEGEV